MNGKRAKNIDVNTGSYQNTMTVIEGKMIQGRKRTKDENFRTGDNMACVIKLSSFVKRHVVRSVGA